jgi:hypothetical protein
MTIRPSVWLAVGLVAVLFLGPTATWGRSDGVEIDAQPVPGRLDLMHGTAIQLGSRPGEDEPQPSSYRWEIVEGEGGKIYNADKAEAIFQAPTIENELEVFVVQLTAEYPVQKPSRARLHIRVHKNPPEKEKSIQQIMAETYRREEEARDRRRSRSRASSTIVHHHAYPPWHFGFSWGWGWPVYYPIYVPIPLPPPGIDWQPGDGDWLEPTPLPYDEMVSTFPEHIADDYLPQDYPLAEPMPDAFVGDSPHDFIEVPDMGGGADFGPPDFGPPGFMDDPGFGGVDFAEPMIDPGFGFDDFGW